MREYQALSLHNPVAEGSFQRKRDENLANSASKFASTIHNAVKNSIGKVTPSSVSDITAHTLVRLINVVNDLEFITEMRNDIGKPSVHVILPTPVFNILVRLRVHPLRIIEELIIVCILI